MPLFRDLSDDITKAWYGAEDLRSKLLVKYMAIFALGSFVGAGYYLLLRAFESTWPEIIITLTALLFFIAGLAFFFVSPIILCMVVVRYRISGIGKRIFSWLSVPLILFVHSVFGGIILIGAGAFWHLVDGPNLPNFLSVFLPFK